MFSETSRSINQEGYPANPNAIDSRRREDEVTDQAKQQEILSRPVESQDVLDATGNAAQRLTEVLRSQGNILGVDFRFEFHRHFTRVGVVGQAIEGEPSSSISAVSIR